MWWDKAPSKAEAAQAELDKEIDEVAAGLIENEGIDIDEATDRARELVAKRRKEAAEKKSLRLAAEKTFGGLADMK